MASITDVYLGVGIELLMLGIATGIASISDEIGNIILVFMIGLVVLWIMYHAKVTKTIPLIFTYLQNKGAA